MELCYPTTATPPQVTSKQHSGWNYSKFTANIYRQFSSFSYSLLKYVTLSVSTFELLLK